MAGQIFKQSKNTFCVRIFMGRDDTGKRIYVNKTIKGTKKDAQKYLTAALRDKDLGVFIEPAAISVNRYLDKWLETAAKPRLRERTYSEYVALLRRYVREPLGRKQLSDLRPLDIQQVYAEMQERGLSPRVIQYTNAVLSSGLKQAVRWGMLSRNPASLVQLPKQTRKEMNALSPEQTAGFLEALANDRYATLFSFAVITGMRPEEYFGLQWKDLDLTQGTATVVRALVWRTKGGGWYFTDVKTSRSRRTIFLPRSTTLALSEHKRHQAEERLRVGPRWHDLGLVFTTSLGTPLNISNLTRKHFKPALKRAGLSPSIRLYDLRHTCATLLLKAEEHPKVVSERLGHSSVALTLDVYSHVLPEMQKAAAEKLENLLFTKTGTV